jgi:hypothetical protein
MTDAADNYLRAGIHGHCACDRRHWIVVHRRCNYSAFNGSRWTLSAYSRLVCSNCWHTWRTKATYVDQIPDGQWPERKHGADKVQA